jgi:preprotein translocase subunit Sss1
MVIEEKKIYRTINRTIVDFDKIYSHVLKILSKPTILEFSKLINSLGMQVRITIFIKRYFYSTKLQKGFLINNLRNLVYILTH